MAIPYFESQSKCFETIIDSDKILKEMCCVQISSLTIDEQFSFGRKDDGSYLLWLDVIFLHFSLISLKEKVFSGWSVCLASTTERSPICFFLKKNSSIIIYFLDKWKQNSSYAKVGPSRSINIPWEEKNNNKKLSVVRCFISPSPVDIIFHASSSKCELNRLWGGRRQIEKKNTHIDSFFWLAWAVIFLF